MSDWVDFLEAEAGAGRFLPWREVHRTAGLSRTTAWRLQRAGQFPAPYRLSPGRVGYSEVEIAAWKRWRTTERERKPRRASVDPQTKPAPFPRVSKATTPPAAAPPRPIDRSPERIDSPVGPLAKSVSPPTLKARKKSRARPGNPDQTVFDF
ncbi:helix-turn-helix transcriptional regulator [Brevundimonas staleyi]|uniref:Helix-turn-helix transcriptional regulator n=1 Tax=Brevundimonas staleyi TaxID=74326 RepID=A0ABW0FUA8_9CAUL